MIPEIETDETLIEIIDELKHRLKAGLPYSPFRANFNELLDNFIRKWKLDSDPHRFACKYREEDKRID